MRAILNCDTQTYHMYCFIATEQERKGSSAGFVSPEGHHTMEFFEMCAALITQLAR